jgi:hypothetical protein
MYFLCCGEKCNEERKTAHKGIAESVMIIKGIRDNKIWQLV